MAQLKTEFCELTSDGSDTQAIYRTWHCVLSSEVIHELLEKFCQMAWKPTLRSLAFIVGWPSWRCAAGGSLRPCAFSRGVILIAEMAISSENMHMPW